MARNLRCLVGCEEPIYIFSFLRFESLDFRAIQKRTHNFIRYLLEKKADARAELVYRAVQAALPGARFRRWHAGDALLSDRELLAARRVQVDRPATVTHAGNGTAAAAAPAQTVCSCT